MSRARATATRVTHPRVLLITRADFMFDEVRAMVEAARGRYGVALLARWPSASPREVVLRCRMLRPVLDDADIALVVSARPDLATVVDAAGVHLKERGMDARDARAIFAGMIGRSRHDAEGLAECHADYATLSPFAEVAGKNEALGPERFAELAAHANVPVLALGGIDAHNVESALAAGASGIAILRAAHDPSVLTQLLDRIAPPG